MSVLTIALHDDDAMSRPVCGYKRDQTTISRNGGCEGDADPISEWTNSQKMNPPAVDGDSSYAAQILFFGSDWIEHADNAVTVWGELRPGRVSPSSHAEGVAGNGNPVEMTSVGVQHEGCATAAIDEDATTVR